LENIEPAAYQAVSTFVLWSRKLTQTLIHRLDPQCHPSEFHSQWIKINAIDTALNDMSLESSAQPIFEFRVIPGTGRDSWEG
jgi:hypothetical protein